MIAAIVAPAGVRSIAIIRACLVSGPAADLDDAGADRLRDAGLAVFRAVGRVAAIGLVLGLVMGSSEVSCDAIRRTTSAPPGQFTPAGLDPEARLNRPKSPQQRSDQAGKPVKSEQDSCSFSSIALTPSP
jgi:hypothetical protein